MEDDGILHLVYAGDGEAFLVSHGIAAADEHHADSGTWVGLHGLRVEVAVGHALKQIDDVALQSRHHYLSLRIAHAAVVLNDHGVAVDVDQTKEDEAFVIELFLSQSLYGRTDDAVFHLLHPFLGGKGNR